jgi:hypothetical protein
MIYYVCGMCGTDKSDYDTGYCVNGHDAWVCLDDFYNEDLKGYVDSFALRSEKIFELLKGETK